MKNKKGFKLIKKAISCVLLLSSLSVCGGCAKEVDCSIAEEHVHLYVNEDAFLSRYVDSEKEYVGNLFRTETYLPMTDTLRSINDNSLYRIEDNLEYLVSKINEYPNKRQSYSYGYIYGSYYGYGYGLNPATGDFEYHYGLKTGWHYGYDWQDIGLDEYTDDRVRDITYTFNFYKLNDDGSILVEAFDSLEEVPEEYQYFKTNDLVEQHISESYYLEKVREKVK